MVTFLLHVEFCYIIFALFVIHRLSIVLVEAVAGFTVQVSVKNQVFQLLLIRVLLYFLTRDDRIIFHENR
ncbi:hypothetical protein D3C78_1907800 [compost metagenome]